MNKEYKTNTKDVQCAEVATTSSATHMTTFNNKNKETDNNTTKYAYNTNETQKKRKPQ